MSLVCPYSDSEGEEDKDERLVLETEQTEENDQDKLSISKVNERPYGLIVTEETTEIDKKDMYSDNEGDNNDVDGGGHMSDNDNDNNNENNGNDNNDNKDDEMSYQIADSENDKINNCHTIIHTKLENIDQPKEIYEPDTPSRLQSPAYVSTPPHSKDPNFKNLYPPNISSPSSSPSTTSTTTTNSSKKSLNNINNNNIDTSFIPDPPKGEIDLLLQEKIIKFHKMKQSGISINESLRTSQSFKNPSIFEKLISFCEIDEVGSNFPITQFNPHSWSPSDYYEQLNKRQREMDDKRELERINRMKIDFVPSGSTNIDPNDSSNSSSGSNNNNNNNNSSNIINNTSTPDNTKVPEKPKKKYNKWEKEKHKQKLLQQQKSKSTVISAAPSIVKKRENPSNTPASTTTINSTNNTTTKNEGLMKRFRTNGF